MSHTKKHKRYDDRDDDNDEYRKHRRSKTIEEPTSDPSFDWLGRRDYLTETYLIDNIMFRYFNLMFVLKINFIICSSSSPTDIEDFWKFVQKYQIFQQRRKQPPKPIPPGKFNQ